MNERMKASDLYGGRDRLIILMTSAVKEALAAMSEDSRKEIENNLPISFDVIPGILSGNKQITYDLFVWFVGCLDLRTWDILGKPVFTEEIQKMWESEMIRYPMVSSGPPITLNMYVHCRLIQELCDSENYRKEWWREKDGDYLEKIRRMYP